MFGAPNRTAFDLNFAIFGIPVRVHPLFWLVSAILGFQPNNPAGILLWVAVVFVSILIHELGHALTMRLYGHNPSIVLYAGGGLAMYQSLDSPWANFSSNFSKRDSPWSKIIISAAGPAAGFLLAGIVVLYVIVAAVSGLELDHPLLSQLVFFLLLVNIFWGLVNLLPIYPLDGGQIARELFLMFSTYDGVRRSLWLSLITAACVAGAGLMLGDYFIGIMFAMFAVMNWQMLQMYGGGGGFGGGYGGGRPW